MKKVAILLIGVILGFILGLIVGFDEGKRDIKSEYSQQCKNKESLDSLAESYGLIFKYYEEARINHDKFINLMVDAEFNDPNNHYPKRLIKLNLQQIYDQK